MGCVPSKVEDEEAVRRCKERKKLIKQLLTCRADLAASHFAYLKSLRDTGSALRQFAEVESPVDPTKPPPPPSFLTVPPSPPPLPPSPPPPPQFSPIVHKYNRQMPENFARDNYSEIDSETESCVTPRPPPPPPGVDWKLWDPFDPPVILNSSSISLQNRIMINSSEKDLDDEYWEEINADFKDEEKADKLEGEIEKGKVFGTESRDDNVSQASWHTKESDVAPTVLWRNKKSLIEIVKEIDELFLRAAAGGQDVVSFLEMDSGRLQPWENDGKKGTVYLIEKDS